MKFIPRSFMLPLAGLLFPFLQACDNSGLIGLDDQEFVNGRKVDTFSVSTQLERVPRTRTDNNVGLRDFTGFVLSPISFRPVGYFNDPVFGVTEARSFSQVFSTGGHFGEDPVLDSAVLILRYPPRDYQGIYGDTLSRLNIVVEELNETIVDTAAYYADQLFSTGPQIGYKEFTVNRRDSMMLQAIVPNGPDSLVKAPPHLRIRLDNAYATSKFLNIDTAILNDQEKFLEYFKGISLRMDSSALSSNGALLSFNLASNETSEIRLYYRTNNNEDTLSKSFPMNSAAAQTSYMRHDYSGTPVKTVLDGGDDGLLYFQGLQGLQARIRFPYLERLADSGQVNINKAELILTVDPGSALYYHPTPQLFIHTGPDEEGYVGHIVDTYVNPSVGTLFNGVYQKNTNSYRFNITYYVQEMLKGEVDDDSLYIGVLNNATNSGNGQIMGSINGVSQPSRVVVGAATHPEYRARVEIVFSK